MNYDNDISAEEIFQLTDALAQESDILQIIDKTMLLAQRQLLHHQRRQLSAPGIFAQPQSENPQTRFGQQILYHADLSA